MVTVMLDWITLTHRLWNQHDHLTPVIIGRVCGSNAVPSRHRTGALGWRAPQAFVGLYDSGMLIVEATSSMAQVVAERIADVIPHDGLSVARIDLQATIWVADADAIITTTVPNSRYKCTIMRELYGRGCTLYVGAPASDARLRVYNKTAESGIAPEGGGEWLRFELQLRNKYADRAWASWRNRAQGGLLCEYVRKMLDERCYRLVRDSVEYDDAPILDEETDDDWIERRLYWLRHTVVPALRRLALYDENMRKELGLAICAIMGVDEIHIKNGSELGVAKED